MKPKNDMMLSARDSILLAVWRFAGALLALRGGSGCRSDCKCPPSRLPVRMAAHAAIRRSPRPAS